MTPVLGQTSKIVFLKTDLHLGKYPASKLTVISRGNRTGFLFGKRDGMFWNLFQASRPSKSKWGWRVRYKVSHFSNFLLDVHPAEKYQYFERGFNLGKYTPNNKNGSS